MACSSVWKRCGTFAAVSRRPQPPAVLRIRGEADSLRGLPPEGGGREVRLCSVVYRVEAGRALLRLGQPPPRRVSMTDAL